MKSFFVMLIALSFYNSLEAMQNMAVALPVQPIPVYLLVAGGNFVKVDEILPIHGDLKKENLKMSVMVISRAGMEPTRKIVYVKK